MCSRMQRLIRGKLHFEDGVPAALLIVIKNGAEVVGHAVSAPDGRFVAEITIQNAPLPAAVEVEVQDLERCVLASAEHCLAPGNDTPLVIKLNAVPPACGLDSGFNRLLVNREAAERAAQRLSALESAGEVPSGATATLRAAMAPLQWASKLQAVVPRALEGVASAQHAVRSALAAWTPSAWPTVDATEPVEDVCDLGASPCQGSIFNAEGLVLLALGAVKAGRDDKERQMLLDGLSAAVWNMHWISQVEAGLRGDNQLLQLTLGTGGMDWDQLDNLGRPPEINLPSRALHNPKLGKSIPIKVGTDTFAKFNVPREVKLPPIVKCVRDALAEVRKIEQTLPKYQITGLDPANACVGTEITLTGKNFGWFGETGVVLFPGAEETVRAETVFWWTDTSIRLIVPLGATPGQIQLSILEGNIERCGLTYHIYREGSPGPVFSGGLPKLRVFVDYVQTDTICAPNRDIDLSFDCTELPSVTVRAMIYKAGTILFDSGLLPGGSYHRVFRTPIASAPTDLLVRVVAIGPCGSTVIKRTLTIAVQPSLSIAHIEVVQAIQRFDNSVPLVSGRTTGVRVYVTSGLSGFSYTPGHDEVSNVTGTLEIYNTWDNNKLVGKIAATAPREVGSSFDDTARANKIASVNFFVPGDLIEEGELSFRVSIKPNPLPHGMRDLPAARGNLTLQFWRRSALFIVAWRVQDTHPAHPAAAPSTTEWDANFVGVRDRFPTGDADYLMQITPGFEVFTASHDLTEYDGWVDLIDGLDDFADRFADVGQDYVCITPSNPAYDKTGIAHEFEATNGPWSAQHSIAIAQAGLTGTCAHELLHTYGLGHAPDQDPGMEPPDQIDPRLPKRTELGAVGWRASDDRLFVNQPDIMSYRGIDNDRWPSIATWNIIFDRLN